MAHDHGLGRAMNYGELVKIGICEAKCKGIN